MKTWINKVSARKGYKDSTLEQANAKIFTFGSYRLGVRIRLKKNFFFFVGFDKTDDILINVN